MGDLTNNLSRYEFACQCGCGFNAADKELVEVMQEARDALANEVNQDLKIIVTSGNRCKEHNEAEGGAEN